MTRAKLQFLSDFRRSYSVVVVLSMVAILLVGLALHEARASEKKDSQIAKRGKAYFKSQNCNMCHSVKDSGGCLAPPLDGVGKRRNRAFLIARITDDEEEEQKFFDLYGPELMPHVRLPEDQAACVVEYLLTLPVRKSKLEIVGHGGSKEKASVEKPLKPRESRMKTVARGKRLVFKKGCMACHSIGEIGGTFGPALDGVGSRRGHQYIVGHMLAAEKLETIPQGEYGPRGTIMPPSGLTKDEIRAIAAFLETLTEF